MTARLPVARLTQRAATLMVPQFRKASSLPRYGIRPADPSTPEVSKRVGRALATRPLEAQTGTERPPRDQCAANFSEEPAKSRAISAHAPTPNGSA